MKRFHDLIRLAAASIAAATFLAGTPVLARQCPPGWSDGNFGQGTWGSAEVFQGGNGGTAQFTRPTTGGTPANSPYGDIQITLNNAPSPTTRSSAYVGSLLNNATVAGPISSVDFILDSKTFGNAPNAAAVTCLLYQNNTYYMAFTRRVAAGNNINDTWAAQAILTLTQNQFQDMDSLVNGTTPRRPDFSSGTAPITFGFVVGASTAPGGAGGSTRTGIDNAGFIIHRLAPTNNNCSNCLPLTPTSGLATIEVRGTTCHATMDGSASCATTGADVWYCYTTPCPSPTIIETCASFDTALSVHSSCAGGELLCNDNSTVSWCSGPTNSRVAFTPVANQTYYIRVAGPALGQGDFTLRLTPTPQSPVNELCQNATPLPTNVTNFPFNTCFANLTGPGSCPANNDIWYTYTAPCTGCLIFSLVPSQYDTYLGVYSGSCSNPIELACNDDNGPAGGGLSSSARVCVTAGTTYRIRIGGYAGARGNGLLSIYPDPGTISLASRTVCQGNPLTWTATSTSVPAPTFLWERLQGSTWVGVSNSATYTLPSVALSHAGQYRVTSTTTCGVSRTTTATATLTVTPGPPANDACANAAPLVPILDPSTGLISVTVGGSTTCATPDGTAACGSSNFTNSVWYTYFSPCAGPVQLTTCPSTYDTVLSTYWLPSGACPSGLTPLLCNDDTMQGPCANTGPSALNFTSVAGRTYYIRVSGVAGSVGTFSLTLSRPAVLGDSCGSPIVLSPSTSTLDFDTQCATTDGFASSSCGGDGQIYNDLWYDYTAPCNGFLTLSTCDAASFDTRIAVYAFDAGCPTNAPLACSDNATNCSNGTTRLSLPVTTGRRVRIRVGGSAFSSGTGTLSIQCSESCPVSFTVPGQCASQQDPAQTCDILTKVFRISGTATGDSLAWRIDISTTFGTNAPITCFYENLHVSDVPVGAKAVQIGEILINSIRAMFGDSPHPADPINGRVEALYSGEVVEPPPLDPNNPDFLIKIRIGKPVPAPSTADFQLSLGVNGVLTCVNVGVCPDPPCGPCPFNPTVSQIQLSGFDRNGNGEDDTIDILIGASLDLNGDGIPDDAAFCPCDWNQSGELTSQDFFDFIGSFFAGNGDINNDGETTSQDFFDFVTCFVVRPPGCP